MSDEVYEVFPSDPAARRDPALLLAAIGRAAAALPPGTFLLLDPADPARCAEVTVGDGPPAVALHDAPAFCARLDHDGRPLLDPYRAAVLAAVVARAAAAPDGVARFSFSELAAEVGHPRPGGGNIETLRRAIVVACLPAIHRISRVAGLPPVESVDGPLAFPPRIEPAGRPGGAPRRNEVALHAAAGPLVAAGGWSCPPADLLGAPDSVTAALRLLAPLLTLRPADADGLVRARLPFAVLRRLLVPGDRVEGRARRRVLAAVERLAGSAAYHGSSADPDGEVVLVRSRPLRPLAAAVGV